MHTKLHINVEKINKRLTICLIRDSTNRYWGENKGSDAQKNQHANEILRRIFRATVWINLHQLPVRLLLSVFLFLFVEFANNSTISLLVRFVQLMGMELVGPVMGQHFVDFWSHIVKVSKFSFLFSFLFLFSPLTHSLALPDGHEKGWKH